MEAFSVFMPFCYSASRPFPHLPTSRARSPLFKSLCSPPEKKRACLPLEPLPPVAAPFDVRQREMAVSPHLSASAGSPKVDFEPQSVKLGLIATRGAARFGVHA